MRRATQDNVLIRLLLTGVMLGFIVLFLVFPVMVVLYEAFSAGVGYYISSLLSIHSLTAIRLTLLVALAVVPMNGIFGICAAWSVTHFHFPGKRLLVSLIELPLWVSPVVGGLVYALVFGHHGWLGPWLEDHNIHILFAYPGIVLATAFVTFPFVARGLIPLMQAQGSKEEEAALTLGANGWQLFWRVNFPKIKWGVLYGVVLCNARAMGEFGAVSVVSGNIQDLTNTIPLQIQQNFDGFDIPGSFALASLLLLLAVVTLMIKVGLEWRRLAPPLLRPH